MTADSRPPLVDTHAHLQDPAFADDRGAVLERALAAGLRALVCVGYDLDSSRRAVALAAQHPRVWATVGIHPNSSGRATERDWAELCELARAERVVGLGETGLDNYRKTTPPEVQQVWLRRHLALADELGLPVVIHNREASEPLRAVLHDWRPDRSGGRLVGVMHCFSADRTMLEASLEAGFVISIAGPVTYKNADELRTAAALVPADRLVVETDCPYLTPQVHRGQRNEPAFVAFTAERLAELRGVRYADLAAQTTANAAALFALTIPPDQGA
jgi:TatD DNase family protein